MKRALIAVALALWSATALGQATNNPPLNSGGTITFPPNGTLVLTNPGISGATHTFTFAPTGSPAAGELVEFNNLGGKNVTSFQNLSTTGYTGLVLYGDDNGILTLGSITGGSSYTNGTYLGVSLTGGSGSGATADITVSGNAVTAVLVRTQGRGYLVNDSLSAAAANIGGTGSGFSVPVATIMVPANQPIAHSTFGWGNSATGGNWQGAAFWECSSYTGVSNTLTPPPCNIVQTGYFNATFAYGSYLREQFTNTGHTQWPALGGFINVDYDAVNSWWGWRRTPQVQQDINLSGGTSTDRMVISDAGTDHSAYFSAGYMVNLIYSGNNQIQLAKQSVTRTGVGVSGTSNVSADRRADFSDIDGSIVPFSISLNASGTVQALNEQIGFTASSTLLTLNNGELGFAKITASASAPGASGAKLAVRCGTNAGSAKIVAYAGTSSTGVTVLDNIGSGVTGC